MNTLVLWALLGASSASATGSDLERALAAAGSNRAELEAVLTHFGDREQELTAAEFLIANMPGHGYVEYGLFTTEGDRVPYEALDHGSLGEAQAALDALETEHGELEFEKLGLVEDVESITARFLIDDIEAAFEAWRTVPPEERPSFEAFCQFVLPYRGSNEPLEAWRRPCRERLAELFADGPAWGRAAARRIEGQVGAWVRFHDLYYLHPTDQGFGEMLGAGRGRCEDITNMTTYALRSAAIPVAGDYTPWWPNRDNNHAWPVVLGADGRGNAALSNPPAKVYRKTYANQPRNLAARLAEGETAPRWLDRGTYLDVTEQYVPTSDVAVRLPIIDPDERFAYLCVFNGGEWRAIHWGAVANDAALFTDMGRGVLYLPATWDGEELKPAADPFWLAADGSRRVFQPRANTSVACELNSAGPAGRDRDEAGRLISRLAAGTRHELFVWRDGWESVGAGETAAEGSTLKFEGVPASGLYWLVADGSRRLERVFALDDGEPFWM